MGVTSGQCIHHTLKINRRQSAKHKTQVVIGDRDSWDQSDPADLGLAYHWGSSRPFEKDVKYKPRFRPYIFVKQLTNDSNDCMHGLATVQFVSACS